MTLYAATCQAPGFTPPDLSDDDIALMARQIAACCAEAGEPTKPYMAMQPDRNWYFPGVSQRVLDRARALVFLRWSRFDLLDAAGAPVSSSTDPGPK